MITGKNRSLYSAETTGISTDSSTPKIQDSARRLWGYILLYNTSSSRSYDVIRLVHDFI